MPTIDQPSDADKKLQIKIGVVKRCSKEIEMYKKEMSQQQARISKMESEQACPHEIKKQHEVLIETKNMIPDCEARFERARQDLSNSIMTVSDSVNPALLAEARSLL